MNKRDIGRYLQMVGEELEEAGTSGEILLLGGAVMILQVGNRGSTQDIDVAFEQNGQAIRAAMAKVAQRERLPRDWMNDGAKGFLYTRPPTSLLGTYAGLEVYIPELDYLLAMKIVAGRRRDLDDSQALIRHLKIRSSQEVLDILTKYIPSRHLTAKVQYTVEDLF